MYRVCLRGCGSMASPFFAAYPPLTLRSAGGAEPTGSIQAHCLGISRHFLSHSCSRTCTGRQAGRHTYTPMSAFTQTMHAPSHTQPTQQSTRKCSRPNAHPPSSTSAHAATHMYTPTAHMHPHALMMQTVRTNACVTKHDMRTNSRAPTHGQASHANKSRRHNACATEHLARSCRGLLA